VSARRGSIVRRVALASMAVALAAVSLLGLATWVLVSSANSQSIRATVDTDLAGLADIYSTGGQGELVARIEDRLALDGLDQRRAHYLVTGNGGKRIAGDLQHWPALSADRSEAGHVALDGGKPAFARATRLSRDLSIVVAREEGRDRALLANLMAMFLVAGVAVVLVVGLLARAQSRRIAGRVEAINAAYRGTAPGRAAALTGDSTDDEIGELARHSGAALERVGRLFDAQRHVSDNVAHEIRTPLMRLDQRLLALLKASDAPAAASLDGARTDIRGIVAMLDSLLDIAASAARRGDPGGLSPFDLSALAADVADVYRSSMEEAGLGFEANIAPEVTMLGEPMQITRLISNLLDNAIKFVPAGGIVRLEVTRDGSLVVSDDGPGIPPEARATIFNRFRRGDHNGPIGHGLGLALARAIAERHGMTLRLERTAVGASFRMAVESK
jgi:signal transduction histidine kinase